MQLRKTLVADDLNDALIECRVQAPVKANFQSIRVLYLRQKVLEKQDTPAKFLKISRLVHELVIHDRLTGKETVEVNKQHLAYLPSLGNFWPFVQRDILKIVERKR